METLMGFGVEDGNKDNKWLHRITWNILILQNGMAMVAYYEHLKFSYRFVHHQWKIVWSQNIFMWSQRYILLLTL